MKKVDEYTEQFRNLYERFIIGCDAVEAEGRWNKEELGEMDAFYMGDMVSIILRLIASDGDISEKEVIYLNKNFGFDYSLKELREVYDECREQITDSSFDENFAVGVSMLRGINEKMADAYRDILALICDIISGSDGIVSPEETALVEKFKSKL